MIRAVTFFAVCLTLLGTATGAEDPALEGSRITLAPPGEPGVPLVVTGTLRDAGGQPIAGARLRVFQADAEGRYTPERPMDEPHARLAGRLVSDPEARRGSPRRSLRPAPRRPSGSGCRGAELGVFVFEVDQLAHQPIELAVADLGPAVDVVELVVALELGARMRGAGGGVGLAHEGILQATPARAGA